MKKFTLNIGDVAFGMGKVHYTCFGLGSCMGLFLQDRITGASGGAHILMPGNEVGPNSAGKFYNVLDAVEHLLSQFRQNGSNLMTLRAKITGGANVLGVHSELGKRNVETLTDALVANRIYIAATDVGGSQCRTARFDGLSGVLTVSRPGIGEIKNY